MPTVDSFFHVALKTDDLDRSVAFYRDHLGGDLLEREEGGDTAADDVTYAALQVADKRVYCFETAPYEAAGLVDELPVGFLHFGFVVDDVEAVTADLAADGVPVVMEPTEFGDLAVSFVTDPTGARVEFIEKR